MKVTFEEMDGINEDGTVISGGAVGTEEFFRMSRGEGCGTPGCHCSDGYWISMGTKVMDGKRKIMKVKFDSLAEMNKFVDGEIGEIVSTEDIP